MLTDLRANRSQKFSSKKHHCHLHTLNFCRMSQSLQPIPVCRISGIQLSMSFPTSSKSHTHSWTWKSQHKMTEFTSKIWARVQDSHPLYLPLCSKVAGLVLSPTITAVTAIPSFRDMSKTTSWLYTAFFFFLSLSSMGRNTDPREDTQSTEDRKDLKEEKLSCFKE